MIDIQILKIDETKIKVNTDRGTLQEISDHFSFYAHNYQHMPKFKSHMWDGRIRMVNAMTGIMPSGLIEDLLDWAETSNYSVDVQDSIIYKRNVTMESVEKFIETLNIPAKFKPRKYQIEAFQHAMSRVRSGFLSPTSSGKSFIIYLITRFMIKNEKQTLIIVPTVNLVQQLNGDFADYNHDKFLDTHLISSGADKTISKSVTISTWQSLKDMPKKWFDRFDCVMVDEVHGAEAKELTDMLNKLNNTKYRFGFTGTLRDTVSNKVTLEGHFGRFMTVTTLEELEKMGFISKLDIKVTILKYTDTEKAIIRKLKTKKAGDKTPRQGLGAKAYADEMDFLDSHEKRNDFIIKYANTLKGNVLILFRRIDKHGKLIFELLEKNSNAETDYRFVHGGVKVEERERIRKMIDDPKQKKKVIVAASLGTFSTGANMKKIRHIIFVSSTKANVQVMQSIGRGLRLDGMTNEITLHDLSDDLRSSSFTNSAMKHLMLRLEMYDKEKFQYDITSYKL